MIEKNEDLIIDESNFSVYFRDCRNNKPEKNDILAKYSAVAELVAGPLKYDLIYMLKYLDKAVAATKVMKKLAFATEQDSVRVCREICEDLASGMTEEEVENKVYSYEMEMFYYTKREYFPHNDSHWTSINILNVNQFLDKKDNIIQMDSKILSSETADNILEQAKVD